MIAFAILPILTIILLFLFPRRNWTSGDSFIEALVCWGILVVVITESLSLGRLLSATWVMVAWSSVITALIIMFIWRGVIRPQIRLVYLEVIANHNQYYDLFVLILIVLVVTLFTGIIAPPNTADSMTYHMGRVVHWVQDQSVKHYPTAITRQLFMPPFSEFAVLNFQVLTKSDRFANVVQWISMAGSLTGVYLISIRLGANQIGRLLAVVVAATLPSGIIQATSTQTDYVVSLWLVSFVYFLLRDIKSPNQNTFIWAGSALGLALLTKQTGYLYSLPFLGAYILVKLHNNGYKVIPPLLLLVAISIGLNIPHLYRNYSWFDALLAPERFALNSHNSHFGLDVTISNTVRNIALHLPLPRLKSFVEKVVIGIHELLKIDVNDLGTTNAPPFGLWPISTLEDMTGNPLQTYIGFIVLLLIIFIGKWRKRKLILVYSLLLVMSFLLFCSYLRWDPWRARLHLALFILAAPIIGLVISEHIGLIGSRGLAYCLFIAALPWLLTNASRPLILAPWPGILWPIPTSSILSSPRSSNYFNTRMSAEKHYRATVQLLDNAQCTTIGLITSEDGWEYPLWALLEEAGKHFEVIHAYDRTTTPWLEGFTEGRNLCYLVIIGGGHNLIDIGIYNDQLIYNSEYISLISIQDKRINYPR